MIRCYGRVLQVVGLVIEGAGPHLAIGEVCHIERGKDEEPILAEVVGFREKRMLIMPLGETRGIQPGNRIIPMGSPARVQTGMGLLGRVLNAMGDPIDRKGPFPSEMEYPIYRPSPPALFRQRISAPIDVGIKAINGLMTIGKGQRMAIFSGSGVGKSTLLGMIARHTTAQVNVVGLIGERGREVREFIEKDLGEEGLKRSVVVVATSDHPPLIRMRGAYLATTLAEYFRDQGMDVLLMMDSMTRFAMAAREVGLAIGEPPTSKGYTPSVFFQLPKLLERAGTTPDRGSITGIYNVLAEGDDIHDPIVDAIRSIVDGHIVLTRDLAAQNHYPAIDVLGSISRVMNDIVDKNHLSVRERVVSMLAAYKRAEDLIQVGAYVEGSNPSIDRAIKTMPAINEFLRQGIYEKVNFEESLHRLMSLSH
ncbi:MAG: FliI/YscN family ATPase [Deltaproteobacteria bacterium]|nr:FliI/YscN family ATPase [Deltaproteobacteria bacterium]